MLEVTINGHAGKFAEGTTILHACRQLGIEVPAVCNDDRLTPFGGCRLCVVETNFSDRPVTACNTFIAERMTVQTHTAKVEELRRTLLELLAKRYPSEEVERFPDKEFHRWLRHYQIPAGIGLRRSTASSENRTGSTVTESFRDSSHPYIHVDMAKCITCYRCVRICDELQGQFVWRAWNRGDRTRIAPASYAEASPGKSETSTLLSSACVSCGACADTCPTGAIEDQSVLNLHPLKWTRTTCPYCGTGCEMNLGTREDRIVQVKPLLDAPVSKGHLCVKGRYAFGFTHSPDRITEPMIREELWREFKSFGPGQNAMPAEQSSAAILAENAPTILPLRQAESRGEGKPTPPGWQSVSWAEAIQFVAYRLTQILQHSGSNSIGLLGSARGTNEENYLAQKFARIVLGTNNVDCCARVCHAPTAAGMKHMLGTGAATNSFDDIEQASAFLICGCNPTENHPIVGARIKQAVLRGAKLIVIDPREIELARYAHLHLQLRPGTNVPLLNAIAHVLVSEGLIDTEALKNRISDFGAFNKFIAAWTPERAANISGVSCDDIRAAARLYATSKPAMCFHGLGVTEHVQGTDGVMCLVNLALLIGNFGKPGTGVNPLRGQNNVQGAAHMGCEPDNLTGYVPLDQARETFESVWQAPVPHSPGLNLMQMMDAAAEKKLKVLWAIGYDVALTNPNTRATKAALGNLEFVIVQDLFLNELAREFGHVFLPACSPFEKDGTFMNSERRIQRVRKALVPVGNSKPDWEIICAVAHAMGFAKQFGFQSPEEIWNEIRALWKAGAGITYNHLEQHGLQWPCPSEDHPGTPILHTQTFAHGSRAPLMCVQFEATTETTTQEFPFLLVTGRTLYQFNAGTMTMRTPNARFRQIDTLEIAPADAQRLGLHTGDQVRVRSRHGQALMPVTIDRRIKTGELFATFHSAEVFLNNLTGPQRDNTVMTPEYKVVAVNLQKKSNRVSNIRLGSWDRK